MRFGAPISPSDDCGLRVPLFHRHDLKPDARGHFLAQHFLYKSPFPIEDPARFSECALGPQRPHRLAFKEPDKAARPIIMRNIEERAGRPAHTHQGFAEVPKERSNDSRAIA